MLTFHIENLYANSKSVEVVRYEISCCYAALIEIYGLLKVVPFFLDHPIYSNKLGIVLLSHVNNVFLNDV